MMETQLMLTISVDALKVYRTMIEDAHVLLTHPNSLQLSHTHAAANKLLRVIELLTEDIEAAEQPLDPPLHPMRCYLCGCTDLTPCPGGCHWIQPGLCSRCATPHTDHPDASDLPV